MRFAITTSVQPRHDDHPRATQAGAVIPSLPEDPAESVRVRWDTDQAQTLEAVAELRNLSTGG